MDNALLERLERGAEDLAALVAPLSDADLDAVPAPGKWTIRQIVHHLADESDVWPLCIKKAIATPGEHMQLPGFPGNEAWGTALNHRARSVGPAIDLLRAERRYLVELLRGLSGDDGRTIVIVDRETGKEYPLRAADIAAMLADHVEAHLKTIRGILAK